MAQEFLRRRHAAYHTPERTIFSLIKQATGLEAVERHPIVAGYDNEVYSVRTQPGQVFILRIRRYGETEMEQEAWAIQQCRAAGVPVPEVLLVTTISTEGLNREVMVQMKL